MTSKKDTSYKALRHQLDELLAWFDSDDIDVDEAIAKYEKAIAIAAELEQHLSVAENKLKELKAKLPEA